MLTYYVVVFFGLCQSTGSYLGSAPAKLLDDEVLKTVDDNHLVSP